MSVTVFLRTRASGRIVARLITSLGVTGCEQSVQKTGVPAGSLPTNLGTARISGNAKEPRPPLTLRGRSTVANRNDQTPLPSAPKGKRNGMQHAPRSGRGNLRLTASMVSTVQLLKSMTKVSDTVIGAMEPIFPRRGHKARRVRPSARVQRLQSYWVEQSLFHSLQLAPPEHGRFSRMAPSWCARPAVLPIRCLVKGRDLQPAGGQ